MRKALLILSFGLLMSLAGAICAYAGEAQKIVFASDLVDIIGPASKMLGPVQSGGTIVATPEAVCFAALMTPHVRGSHTVTAPVAVEGAQVGDAIAVKIKKVRVLARAAAAGAEKPIEGRFVGDRSVTKRCPKCGTLNPPTELKGTGPDAIRCKVCGSPCIPFEVTKGYTVLFDEDRTIAVTLPKEAAEEIAKDAYAYSAVPAKGLCYPITLLGPSGMPSGIISRVRAMVGNLGTIPAVEMPASHNSGDIVGLLVGASHKWAITKEDLSKRSDSHPDINHVREGAVVICPVKVPGGGIVVGDVHATMGAGEIGSTATDVSTEVTLEVELIKGLALDGPILLPNKEDLPFLARLYTPDQLTKAEAIGKQLGFEIQKDLLPIEMIGTGPTINAAVGCGVERMAKLLDITSDEVKHVVTMTGGVEIGRLPGTVTVTMMVPASKLEQLGIARLAREQYSK